MENSGENNNGVQDSLSCDELIDDIVRDNRSNNESADKKQTNENGEHIKNFTLQHTNRVDKRKQDTSNERIIKLTSVKTLREKIDKGEHLGLKNILEEHKFVGCVDESLALIQHLTRLYLVNTKKLMTELFYQIMIFRFGNFGYLELSSPAPLYKLVMLALDMPSSGWTEEDGSKEDLAKYVVDLLKEKSEMLMDYFSLEINDKGELVSLPLLLDKYTQPNWLELPMFLLRLATEVDWESEMKCFETFCRECSMFFASPPSHFNEGESEDEVETEKKWNDFIEYVIFPSLRNAILPPKKFSEDGTFLEVANLPDLYKVFERC